MLLVGDIGGTTTRLALVSPDADPRELTAEHEYPSKDFETLDAAVEAFLTRSGAKPLTACFSVAGPVVRKRAHLTNLPWRLDEAALAQSLDLRRVDLINDLAAIAYAAPHLAAGELEVVNAGDAVDRGPIAVVAPGTGLGEAFLIWAGDGYVAGASEGGHADFAPANRDQAALWTFLNARFGHVSVERVCSGSGLPNIYEFLRSRDPSSEGKDFAARLAAAADRTPVIVDAALNGAVANPLATRTMQLFVEVLGAEASNLALKVLATGGVYLAGGMPPRLLPQLREGGFMQAFTAKGRFSELLQAVPVKVVTINAALLGATLYGLERAAAV